jgi:hypothetical protein
MRAHAAALAVPLWKCVALKLVKRGVRERSFSHYCMGYSWVAGDTVQAVGVGVLGAALGRGCRAPCCGVWGTVVHCPALKSAATSPVPHYARR